ncbi:asparagine synthase-related protein [Photobacterium rosenbergii]|uniref:asparagine synthase (glutamine-hydrolyzing) n=1 Tax=Photobacterium rosenbergii TaxID=294936 RepID=A0ABU3ZJN1_9GAMM|nr:asparagine synthase-related protein [Photobacterium rosenbergii]MDV5170326.1 asparagine synthase-related protein [Photobacterium rosenbergii]
MSIVAGIFSTRWTPELTAVKHNIEKHISRNQDDIRKNYSDPSLFLCHVDYHSFGKPAMLDGEHSFIVTAGHPLLSSCLEEDLECLLESNEPEKLLLEGEGTFCAFHYLKKSCCLNIYTDSLAIRPYYFMHYKGSVIFSTCLRIFPELGIPIDNNLEALTEIATLGYPLGSKTPYNQVLASRPGEMLQITVAKHPELEVCVNRERYFKWSNYDVKAGSLEEGLSNLDTGFKQAVERYLGADTAVISTLSGGLDSRIIATELKRRGVELECLNFSRNHSQDASYGQEFAAYHQIPLHSIRVTDTQELTVEQRLGKHWQSECFEYYDKLPRPRLFWSGNGGSVCVGQIYTGEAIVEACKQDDLEQLVDCYLEQQMAYIPQRLIKQGAMFQQRLRENIIDSFREYAHLPLLKAYQLFLWENDQHHHVALPFEDMDLFQLDFCLPYYSKSVLAAMFSMDTHWALKHGIYMEWLQQYYPQALKTPWQTYPGHIPCPIDVDKPKANQWQFSLPTKTKNQLLREGFSTVFSENATVFNRSVLGMQCLLTALRLYDCTPGLTMVKRMNTFML